MAAKNERTGRGQGFAVAAQRFPHFELAIRRLMNRSEAFRDMCEELAEAEFALSKIPEAPSALRQAREAEWQELVDRLVGEIKTALLESEAWKSHS